MTSFAERLVAWRVPILVLSLLVTGAFGWYAQRVAFRTVYSDILPAHDPMVRTHFAYEGQYGGPLSVRVILERTDGGDIYDRDTLARVRHLTELLDAIPGVNHDQVFSIASRKVRRVEVDEEGVYSIPLLPANEPLPETPEELAAFRARVQATAGVVGQYVSWDAKATYLEANLIPGAFDYQEVFDYLQREVASQAGEGYRVHLFGQPVLTGWVYTYNRQVLGILALSFGIMLAMLLYVSRSLRLVVLAGVSTAVSAVWGLGTLGLFGWSMDPLVLVIPMLIMARTLSHSVQMGMRYLELCNGECTPVSAAEALVHHQFRPGFLGVVTDAAGIFLIAVADIPLMQKLAVFSGVWALSVVVSVLLMTPLMLSFLKPIEGARRIVERSERSLSQHALDALYHFVEHRRFRVAMWTAVAATTVGALWLGERLTIGELEPGSSLLWPDSAYNRAEALYTERFVGPDQLVVVLESPMMDEPPPAVRPGEPPPDVRQLAAMERMWRYESLVERAPAVRGAVSYVDLLPGVRRALSGNYPKFEVLPRDQQEAGSLTELLQSGAAPGDFDRFFDRQYRHAAMRFFVPDHLAGTVSGVVQAAEAAAAELGPDPQAGRIRIGLGSVALNHATNREVARAQTLNFALTVVAIMVACWLGYRSWRAVGVLLVPLLLTNVVVIAIMVLMGIGINVNTLPIVSVGMGVGIDYGIYLLSRILEEGGSGRHVTLIEATRRAVHTSGRAILFTATTMVVAVGIWYFLSGLRFQAEMGLLLALVMLINCLGALILIPLQIVTFSPRFVGFVADLEGERAADAA